jgi:hypothetical protein
MVVINYSCQQHHAGGWPSSPGTDIDAALEQDGSQTAWEQVLPEQPGAAHQHFGGSQQFWFALVLMAGALGQQHCC